MKTSNLFWQCVSLVLFLCVVVLLFSDEWIVSWPAKVTAVKGDVNGSFFWSNLNFYGIVGVVLALFSLLYTFRSYVSQSQTESNTRNVPIKDQINKFRDLTRHEYRNLVVVLTTAIKFFADDNAKDGVRKAYPSESHILKLQAAPEDFVLDINPQMAATVSEMRLLLRNYNIEINVACNHLVRPAINDDAVYRDYDNLIFKPLFLVRNACNMEAELKEEEDLGWCKALVRRFVKDKSSQLPKEERVKTLLMRSIRIMIIEHVKKVAVNLSKVIEELYKMKKDSPEEFERYRKYFNVLDSNDGLILDSVDHTNALDRSFGYTFRSIINYDYKKRKTMLLQLRFADNEEFVVVRNSVNAITTLLSDFKQLDPERFAWVDEYSRTLVSFQIESHFDFVKFFTMMLKMDVIVELRNIGMVNYD